MNSAISFSAVQYKQFFGTNEFHFNWNTLTENIQSHIKSLNFGNNNVDAYINIDSSIDDQTRINVATNSLSLSQLKSLTPYYSITIKNKNETKKYNNIASILSIDLVDPFEIKRENENYEIVTSGYAHPSYASPVMKDIFKFSYDASIEISDEFLTWFDGCNIILKDIDYINQTWMKKVIDIDNIMKSTDKDASTMIIKKDTSYEIKMIPDPDNDDDKKWFLPPKITEDIYREVIKDSSVYSSNFIIKNVKINKSDSSINVCCVDSMLIKPDDTYNNWKGNDDLVYPTDFKYMYLKKNEESKEYSGWIITEYNPILTGKFQLVTNTVSCKGGICVDCAKINSRKVERPTREILKADIRNSSFLSLGRKYGVSDKTISKWFISYELPGKASELKQLL